MNDVHNSIPSAGRPAPDHASPFRTLCLAVLALLLFLLLVDAAVETFISRSPLRWIIVATVAAYVALSALLWRKLSWATKASASFFVLFGVMAFAAWSPQGSDSPITLLRQPTSTLLSAAMILGILLAGWVLAQLKFLPWPARVAFILLAAYGVAAFVLGIIERTPYAALLHGGSLWEKLPFWLQGGFVGAMVVVPLGLVFDIIERVHTRWRRDDKASSGFQQAIALCMSVVLSLSTLTSSASQGVVPLANNTAELTLPPEGNTLAPEPSPPAVNPDDLITRFDSWIKKTPDVRYSLAAAADALGSGVEPAFVYVRDKISYQAYSGILRGDEQTFLARAGNSFDRSLLLAKLLKLKGVPTRFVSGHLSHGDAEKLFARIFEATQEGNLPTPQAAPGAAAFLSRVKARGRRDYTAIRAALGRSMPTSSGPSREDVLREIENHVWVQAQVDGRWIDLDSSFGDAAPGRSYCQVERTYDQLPSEFRQRVTVRVISESLAGNDIKSETVLEVALAADDLLDRQIFLIHTPAGAAALGGIGGAPQGGNVWAPVLWVDGQSYAGKAVDFNESGSPSGGGGDLFGGAFESSPIFGAEWLEFEVAFPDGHRDVTRRVLADRGLAWRKAGAPDAGALRPLARDENGPLAPRALHNIWFSAGRHNLAGYARALMYLVRSQRGPAPAQTSASAQPDAAAQPSPENQTASAAPSDISFGERVWPLALQNFAFLVWSDHLIVPAVNDSPAVRLYPDSPRILMFSVGPDPQHKGGAYGQYDLRRDYLRGVAREPSAEGGVIERKIWFGALEGALEHEAVTRDAVFSGNDRTKVGSTSGLLTADGAEALRPEDASRGAALASEPETAARMAASLSGGSFLVVPHSASRGAPAGWWEITSTGNTRAVYGADLGGGWTLYRTPGVNASLPNKVYVIDEQTGATIRVERLDQFGPRGPTASEKGGGGNEYITLVKLVGVMVLIAGVLTAVLIFSETMYSRISASLEGIEAADAGSNPGP